MIKSLSVFLTSDKCICGASAVHFSVLIQDTFNDVNKLELALECKSCGVKISQPIQGMKVDIQVPESKEIFTQKLN